MRRFVPSLSALTAFEAAANHRNFTRAGEDLGLTQSGVSRQVATLERFLGLRLFERLGPQLVLTDAGRAYQEAIAPILSRLEEVSIDAVRGETLNDTVRIGVQDSLGSQWLVRRLPKFLDRTPDFKFTLHPIRQDPELGQGGNQVAILRGRGAWTDAHCYRLFAETVAVVASPSVIDAGAEVSPENYHRYPLIQNAHRADSWLQWLDAKGVDRKDRIVGPRFSQTSMVIEAAIAGLGLAIVPTVMVEDELATGRLNIVFGGPVNSGLSYFVVYPMSLGMSKPVLDFRDWLLDEARRIRASDSAT